MYVGAAAGDPFSLGIPRSRLWKQDLVDCDDYCRMAEAVIFDTGRHTASWAINPRFVSFALDLFVLLVCTTDVTFLSLLLCTQSAVSEG